MLLIQKLANNLDINKVIDTMQKATSTLPYALLLVLTQTRFQAALGRGGGQLVTGARHDSDLRLAKLLLLFSVSLIVIVASVGVYGLCTGTKTSALDEEFDLAVTKAKGDVFASLEQQPNPPLNCQPKSGSYAVTYVGEGGEKTIVSSVSLTFKKAIEGWFVNGSGKDANGSEFVVDEGMVSSEGYAYWVQQYHQEDENRKVLTMGRLDYETDSFSGCWRASDGSKGDFERFKLQQEQSTAPVAYGKAVDETDAPVESKDTSYSPPHSPLQVV